jgi:hypothetical protein
MRTTVFFVFCLISTCALSQQRNYKNSIKLSSGRVLFGTGDVVGFSVNIEYAKDIVKLPKLFLSKLLIGSEFSFENGAKNPVVENPTAGEFFSSSFNHISNSVLSAKITYYPFPRLLNGFNVSIGPSVAYHFHSYEAGAQFEVYSPTISRRMSELRFENAVMIGYRITTGYELQIAKRLITGFRLDFSNYNNGDINTLAALKMGYRF